MRTWTAGIFAISLAAASGQLFADGIWGVGVNGGFNTYSFSQLNQLLGANNTASGMTMPGSSAQAGLNVELKYRVADHWLAGFEANYLYADASANTMQQGVQTVSSIKADLTEYLLDGSYIYHTGLSGLDLGLGIGIGVAVLADDNLSITYPEYPSGNFSTPLNGSGFDGKVFVSADYYFIPAMSLDLNLGYRDANVWPVNYTNSGSRLPLTNPNGTDLQFNYSGFNSQLALIWWI